MWVSCDSAGKSELHSTARGRKTRRPAEWEEREGMVAERAAEWSGKERRKKFGGGKVMQPSDERDTLHIRFSGASGKAY